MPRILLVDDDIAEISAVKRVLLRAGHAPALATSAADALAALEGAAPDLVVLAAACDGGEALALARRVAEDAATAHVPMIIVGEADPLPRGARRLPRPIDPAQLQEEVAARLGPSAAAPAPRSSAPAAPARPGPASGAGTDPGAARRAAAEALRARAEELRRSGGGSAVPAPPPRAAATAAPKPAVPGPAARPAVPAASPAGRGAPEPAPKRAASAAPAGPRAPARSGRPGATPTAGARAAPGPTDRLDALAPADALAGALAAGPATGGDLGLADEDGLDALLRRLEAGDDVSGPEEASPPDAADRAVQALADLFDDAPLPAPVPVRAPQSAEAPRHREARRADAAPPRAPAAAASRAPAVTPAAAAARAPDVAPAPTAAARAGSPARPGAELRAAADAAAARAAEPDARARAEADQEALRARGAEEKAAAEAEARRRAEEELQRVRAQLEDERRSAEQRLATVMERAAAEESAAEELRRVAEEDARRRAEEEEEKLRAAIASARAEMEALRRRGEEEARRRAEAEAELRRLAELSRPPAAVPPRAPAGFPFPPAPPVPAPEPFLPSFEPPAAAAPAPADPAEDAARRRVAALRGAAPASPAPRPAAAPAADDDAAPAPPPAELRAGTLADLPAPRLLALAARVRLAGRLDFQGELARSLWFEDGRVVGASSADPAERVEELALRFGLVTRDQHRLVAAAAAALPTRRAALLLLERGFLKPTELTGLARRRTEEVVSGVFADGAARFRWVAQAVPADERTALERGPLALAVEGVRRRWRAAEVEALLGGPGTLLGPAEDAPDETELGLSAEERRVVALADGLRTLDEIVQESPLDGLSTRQALAALVAVGALSVRLLQTGRPAPASDAIDLARVREKLDQVRRADYFTVLGVGRLCTPHEVRDAADRLAAELHPERFAALRDPAVTEALQEIQQVVLDARDVLADDRLRQEYLRGLGDAR
ncbi:response regulator receiver protein [Anaeromyxobacter dehalogenans 2CP-1]|uniref:Response regulator receiver protein n=1 Tax=Anaeromyxobacter dehalogenans (strain ATCC BAA-258 / DSM 21875 / 2CP-1) TaxID=455488 RepID=B8JDM2_ANAD2|nr:DUF4388 domain-containing protein [Anaeromyxobacter dehalogenans]ACL64117.1 response regulator receiver protein [Anaeromyxobacter dehalogenans 2CP-1]